MVKGAWNAPRVTRTAPSLFRVGAAGGAETSVSRQGFEMSAG
jgi:hypothetical protein